MEMMEYALSVNGMAVAARYSVSAVNNIFLPLLRELTRLQALRGGRLIVFLAAPPGAGKSTLSLFLEQLSAATPGVTPLQAVGIDGFHQHQYYLLSHHGFVYGQYVQLSSVKGAPETYDLPKLSSKLGQLRTEASALWPVYDRQNLHDVVEDQLLVDRSIVLLEGNWLLLRDEGWRDLCSLADLSVFIRADEAMLKGRLVRRKISGGLSPDEAEAFYARADGKNVRRALADSAPADIELSLLPDGDYAPAKM